MMHQLILENADWAKGMHGFRKFICQTSTQRYSFSLRKTNRQPSPGHGMEWR